MDGDDQTRDLIVNTIGYITDLSHTRAMRWHGEAHPWSVLEWAGAMCGEAGEAANVAKKILREESGMQNGVTTGKTKEQLDEMFGNELADVFLYLVLCANNRGLNLGEYIIKVFNRKSEEYGFPERL